VVSTVGTRVGFLARMASMGRSSGCLSTSRERHSQALRAWLWVEAATFCCTARWFSKASMSALPISLGWRVSWKNIYRVIQVTDACSVCRKSCLHRMASHTWSSRVLGCGSMVYTDLRSWDDQHTRVGCVPGDCLEDTLT
jgi:hypothetical protein